MLDVIIELLKDYYAKNCKNSTAEYTYGFMDALAYLEEMRKVVK